jgi:murein DD-endopeptidase MepM/ murein hydrolase activator NlpD
LPHAPRVPRADAREPLADLARIAPRSAAPGLRASQAARVRAEASPGGRPALRDRILRSARIAMGRRGPGDARERLVRAIAHPRALPAGLTALVVAAALVSVAPSTVGHAPTTRADQTPRIVAFAGDLRAAAAPAIGATGEARPTVDEPLASAIGREVQVRYIRAIASTAGAVGGDTLEALGPFDEAGPAWAGGPPMVPQVVLRALARRFDVRMATIWWANGLKSTSNLPVGRTLLIPTVDGRVVTVERGDTLRSISRAADVDEAVIVAANGLGPGDVAVGQKLFVPGDVKPLPKPKAPKHSSSSSTRSSGTSGHIVGGWVFPVVGGGAYISQYFHASHPALDIAASYGTPVRAAHAGTVIFAGWKNNGGGWQVWMSHGGNLYTTYNHMSALTVHAGQSIGAGQQVGRIGQSGWATGPHCHFEVWIGRIWDGGTRVNPLNYV